MIEKQISLKLEQNSEEKCREIASSGKQIKENMFKAFLWKSNVYGHWTMNVDGSE